MTVKDLDTRRPAVVGTLPMKVGRLLDHPTTAGSVDYGRRALELVFADASTPVEWVEVDAAGSAERVVAGARRLAASGCPLILGPSITSFAVPLIPVLDELRVPAINWAGSALARGEWGFQLKVGSLPDEAGHLTRLIAAHGHRRVAIARDAGPIGDEYHAFLRRGLETLGIEIVSELVLGTGAEVPDALAAVRTREPGCVLYLGLGPAGVALCRALRALGWSVPIIGNIGLGVFPSPELDGVVFTDVVDETNPVLARLVRRYEERHGDRPIPLGLAAAHDLAATTLEAMRLAPSLTPAGLRAGLEAIRGLPAAVGAPGTTIGFAPWDRDGYKGPLIVYREIRGGRAVPHQP
jgi:ABC-type branched-subunit amino acid transport system substrate-binding protein